MGARIVYAAIAVAAVLLVVVCVARALRGPSEVMGVIAPGGTVDYQRAKAYFEVRIRAIGEIPARKEFIADGNKLAESEQSHELAHAFGGALYAVDGVNGVQYCTFDFAYGCYHQLSGMAIEEHGTSAFHTLADACQKLPQVDQFGCLHGIGHGLVLHDGYTIDDLKKALDTCYEVDPVANRNGCSDGAIMEYDLRTVLDVMGGQSGVRPLTSDNAYSPCDQIKMRDQAACYFERSDWWYSELPSTGSSATASFGLIGSLCDGLSGANKQSCFEGAGFWLASIVSFDVPLIESTCAQMAEGDAGDDLSCLANAARRFRAMQRPEVDAVCGEFGLTGAALAYCNDIAHSSPLSDAQFPRPQL